MENPLPPARLRLNSKLWPALALLLLVLQLIWPNHAWSTLLVILGGGWLAAFLWTRSLARNLFLDRKMRFGWAQVGDRLEERFTITNGSRLPGFWLELEDHSTLPDHSPGRVTSIADGEVLDWRTEGVCTRRGLHIRGPTSLRSGDPFGLFTLEIHDPHSAVLLVLPPVLPLPGIDITPGGRAGDGRRPRRSALETTVSSESVREYHPGDPLKSIHWPTTARRDSLYVRQFEFTPTADWWIVLDLHGSVQSGEGYDSTLEHGVLLAASLADRGLKQGIPVGLAACGKDLAWLPPQRGAGHLMDILRTLAVVQAGDRPVESLLDQVQGSIRRGACLILITPDTSGGWSASLLQAVRNGISPTVMLFDPASFGGSGSAAGAAGLLDEYGVRYHLIPRELLDRPEARPGQQGRWEWRVTGRGKAVAVRRPSDAGWRRVG